MAEGKIRVGVGGWTYEPWRGVFFPKGMPHKEELAYASQRLSSIEVNGTFYRTQTPETFDNWFAETPDDFVFALKAARYTTNRRVLAEAGEAINRFLESGVRNLKHKLGPINWQFAENKQFDPVDFEAFLNLLPRDLKHAVEVRHESFKSEAFVSLVRQYEIGIVVSGDSKHPLIPDPTAPFLYLRIMGTVEEQENGYSEAQLDVWADRAKAYASGKGPSDLPTVSSKALEVPGRYVYLYVISGFKQSNPAAANALMERL